MSVISGILQASAAKKAAKAQEAAAREAAAVQQKQYEQTRADLSPYRDAGTSALPIYQDSMGLNGETGYNNALAKFQTGPGYQFSLSEGSKALENSAAARGGLFSGQTGKALTQFGQGLANQEFGGWQNRLAGLVDTGQNASAQTGNFGANAASNIGNYLTDAGTAKASGYVGAANGYSNALAGLSQIAGYAYGGGFNSGSAIGKKAKGIYGTVG